MINALDLNKSIHIDFDSPLIRYDGHVTYEDVELNDLKREEIFDCSEEDCIKSMVKLASGEIIFHSKEGIEKAKDAEYIERFGMGICCHYYPPKSQKKIINPDGSITFKF